MKKLLFISSLLLATIGIDAQASVRAVANQETASAVAQQNPQNINIPAPTDRFETEGDFKKYLIERLRGAVIMKQDANSASNGSSATSVVEDELPDEYKKKTFYEQVYEDAIKRATAKSDDISNDIDPRILQPELWEQSNQDIPLDALAVPLPPYDEKVAVPPYEHIPYLFSRIEVLPSGLLKIDETIIVVSNAKKLRYPLSRALPSHRVNRDGSGHKIDVSINEVTVNDYPIDYKIIEKGGNIVITPSVNVSLDAGIYKYKFSYVIDRQIAHYDNFDELNWNVSGGNWNLIISRIGATVILPYGKEPIAQRALVGYPFHYSQERTVMNREATNIIGFSSKVPLFVAESMPITVVLPKGVVETPSWSKKLDWLLIDYGNIIIPLIGFLAILLSYWASWKYIQNHNKKIPIRLHKTPQMIRYLIQGHFDSRAFGAFLLDMFRKNIIDIQKNDKRIMLVKRTDNLKTLSKKEKLAIKAIFAKEPVFTINSSSMPKLKQAMGLIKENTITSFNLFTRKLTALYVLCGCGMLLFTEIFTAHTMIDPNKKFAMMITMTIGIGMYLILYNISWKKKWANLLIKAISAIMILVNLIMLSGICSIWGALLILASLIAIMFFDKLYRKRNGLVKTNIAEAQLLQKYLAENSESIALGRDFIAQQANIFAVGVENKYIPNDNIRDCYRLDIIKAIISKM